MKYVYIMKCHNCYKIGISANVRARLSELQVGNPYKIELLATYAVDSRRVESLERFLHDALRRWNVSGEWFELNNLAIKAVRNYCETVL